MAKTLFDKAKKSAAPKETKSNDSRPRIKFVDTEDAKEGTELFDKIQSMQVLQAKMKSDKGKFDMISDEVKDLAKDRWAGLYDKTGRNPDTVVLEAKSENGDLAQVQFIPQDKYIIVSEERSEELKEKYGEDIIEEATTYTFDEEMVEKYGEVLSTLISDSMDIDDEDKEKIIKAVTKLSIKKGTIDKLKSYSKEITSSENVVSVYEVMTDVRPVVGLKGPEVIKG